MSNHVYINDVGPRDGLQNQAEILSPQQRLQLIQVLTDARLDGIEVGAFVSPKAVPAMAGTDEICQQLPKADCHFSALIPNMKGFELAQKNQVKLASLVMAASNTMNEKNIRMDNQQTLSVIEQVIDAGKGTDVELQVYLATAWECPFEGVIPAQQVVDLAEKLINMGASRLVIADTIGAANPQSVQSLMTTLIEKFGADKIACHFHDTRAMGLANVYAALTAGVRRFDASIAGLGGCPFAPGASGNVATEDVVMMCHQMGYETGIDMPTLLAASDLAIELTKTAKGGNAKTWLRKTYPA
ncbi:hydroxymethylglutaryl-CoA lyase [Aliiglaciecola sp. 3_MG-2023]|uniref:hydroxymethylglutaryl-CoA lyase n=1 Tax=Aliiglaciecola sp. 3_MG-2023 TaxID=3062644 RepID=UPI0026E3D8DA|nr:hydroxymethylglutaryl-CoA lyase [Aliiglaciecola sp. 3_MG-2023]MDO6691997.1 hydroxymethylglutaryl-CoA lyase [Aliiglaciecola sp. 3_MG-2023]